MQGVFYLIVHTCLGKLRDVNPRILLSLWFSRLFLHLHYTSTFRHCHWVAEQGQLLSAPLAIAGHLLENKPIANNLDKEKRVLIGQLYVVYNDWMVRCSFWADSCYQGKKILFRPLARTVEPPSCWRRRWSSMTASSWRPWSRSLSSTSGQWMFPGSRFCKIK